jgi:hypothetical protein
MAARRKLDAVGVKLHLAQWEQLGRGERLMICHAPAESEKEQSALRTFRHRAQRHGVGALNDDQRYALIKLGDSERPSHNLELALQEFFENGAQTEAS